MHRAWRPAATLLAGGLLVAGCGGGDGGGGGEAVGSRFEGKDRISQAQLNQAVRRTVESGAFRIRTKQKSVTVASGGSGDEKALGSLTLGFDGRYDPRTRRGTGTADVAANTLQRAPSSARRSYKASVVLDGELFYVRAPVFRTSVARPWVRGRGIYPITGLPHSTAMPADPALAVELLRAAQGPIKRTGTETLRGVPTTKYEVTLDFYFVEPRVPGRLVRPMREAEAATFTYIVDKNRKVTVWIGRDGVVRRMDWGYIAEVCDRTEVEMSLELWDFRLPPATVVPRKQSVRVTQDLARQGGFGSPACSGVPGAPAQESSPDV